METKKRLICHMILCYVMCLISVNAIQAADSITLTVKSINDFRGGHSTEQSLRVLDTKDLFGETDNWDQYIEFSPESDSKYSGCFTFNLPASIPRSDVEKIEVLTNYMGPDFSEQRWKWKIRNFEQNRYIFLGNNKSAQEWFWTQMAWTKTESTRYINDNGIIKIKLLSNNNNEICNVDQLVVVVHTTDGGPPPIAPETPEALTAIATSHSMINLTWHDMSDNEESFVIQRRVIGGTFQNIKTLGAGSVSFSDTSLVALTEYTYRIKAENSAGSSGWSDIAYATTDDEAVIEPETPEVLEATTVSKTVINLTWRDMSDNEESFVIERMISGGTFQELQTMGANSTSFSDTGLTASTEYTYRIKALNSAGDSEWSETATASTMDDDEPDDFLVVDKVNGPYKTIAAAMRAVTAGQTIQVRAGVYKGNVVFSKSGSASEGYITLQGDPGAIIDGSGVSAEDLVAISNKSYVKLIGFEIRNLKQNGSSVFPKGIFVDGSGSHIEIRNNTVWGIENTNANAGAHGIAIYGTSNTPISDITIDGNEIHSCKLGWSESMVVNGNVTNFIVSKNIVHDNNNIGIDFIGYEGTCPTDSTDRARDGVCVDNTVYNITSANNPSYGGERSADGIYVDGGKNIIIERNKVDNCDIGIELASEHKGKSTSDITVRNNFVSRSYQGNIQMGGYASNRGNAANIVVVNNTTYQAEEGEIVVQFNTRNVTIKNNILFARSGQDYLCEWGNNNSSISVDTNIYYGSGSSSSGAWSDMHPNFVNPQLVSPYSNLHISSRSPAINEGLNLGTLSGIYDIDGEARENAVIDIGADER